MAIQGIYPGVIPYLEEARLGRILCQLSLEVPLIAAIKHSD